MKRIHVKNGLVDAVELHVADASDQPGSYVVADDLEVFRGYADNGDGTFTAPDAPAPTRDDVSLERDRRIASGHTIVLSDARTFTVQTRNEADFRNINGLVLKDTLLQMQSDTTTEIIFRDADNVDQTLTAPFMIELGNLVAAAVDNLYKKSWTLKDADPIPSDYTDDSYWA